MDLPLGSTDVSASGGTMRLVGRLGEARLALVDHPMPLDEAVDLLGSLAEPPAPVVAAGPLVPAGESFLAPGTEVCWTYHGTVDMARVLRDDADGLVVWVPTGSARLNLVAADGRVGRGVPLEDRFSIAWRMAESTWRGPGVVRCAPTGRPWSLWWFFDEQGTFGGLYVNLELPHRRPASGDARTHTRDLTLDLWVEPTDDGRHELWVKDEDELDVATSSGRFTARQREAVVAIGEWAARELFDAAPGLAPWDAFRPTPEQDLPVALPDTPLVAALRALEG